MVADVDGGCVRCWSRHGTDQTGAVGDVVGELRELVPYGTLVDGELVALAMAANREVGQTSIASDRPCLVATITR